jgi:RiboL-PSP-HEPN
MSFVIENRFKAVEKVVLAAQAKGLDPEVASYYCRLGAVLVCGNIERCVEILLTDRICEGSIPQVGSFLNSYFKRGTNYDCETLSKLLFRFDSGWGHKFRNFIEKNDEVKEGITSCYAVRNSIAHGGSNSIGPTILRQYYENSITLIAELESVIRRTK